MRRGRTGSETSYRETDRQVWWEGRLSDVDEGQVGIGLEHLAGVEDTLAKN